MNVSRTQIPEFVKDGIVVFDKVLPNPTVEIVEQGVTDYIAFEPDCVIAFRWRISNRCV